MTVLPQGLSGADGWIYEVSKTKQKQETRMLQINQKKTPNIFKYTDTFQKTSIKRDLEDFSLNPNNQEAKVGGVLKIQSQPRVYSKFQTNLELERNSILKKQSLEQGQAEEMAQWLRTFTAFAEDLGSDSSTHIVTYN